MQTKGSKISMALWLSIPMIIFYLNYLFNHNDELTPTGFIQYDNVSYIAYAKQYLDADSFHLQYSNPFNDKSYTAIYFQPQTLLFYCLLKAGIPVGWILIPFAFIFSIICFLLIISIYDYLIPGKEFRNLIIWLFGWGGGMFVLAGVTAHFFLHRGGHVLEDLFILDPANGWWGLSLGRSLFFTCEAYYHALFLGTVYFLLRKRWIISIVLIVILLFSHPFTSLELILIVCLWCLVELAIDRKFLPPWFIAASLLSFICYISYYLIYLNQFPDHRSVANQYSLNWRLRYYSMIPAYCIVGTLAFFAIYKKRFKKFFQVNSNRLFACWFVVAFLLANHEIFMSPKQPIHFTRGYIWISLFLLGLPALQRSITYLRIRTGKIILILFIALFMLDNFAWIFSKVPSKSTHPSSGYITPEQNGIFKLLNNEANNEALIISNDENISYLSTVYTKAYPWVSHPFTTPFIGEKEAAYDSFMQRGEINPSWLGRNVFFVLMKNIELKHIQRLSEKIIITKRVETDNYLVLQCDSLRIKP